MENAIFSAVLRIILFLLLELEVIEITHFLKDNYQITETEEKILKNMDQVSEKGVTISGIQRILKKILPPPLRKPLWEKLCAKCNKIAKLMANSKSQILFMTIKTLRKTP